MAATAATIPDPTSSTPLRHLPRTVSRHATWLKHQQHDDDWL